jgi:hypothetical protein
MDLLFIVSLHIGRKYHPFINKPHLGELAYHVGCPPSIMTGEKYHPAATGSPVAYA